MGVPPWELAGLPESKNTIWWSDWIGIVAQAEAEAQDTLRKQHAAGART